MKVRDCALLRRSCKLRGSAIIDEACKQALGDVPESLEIGCSDGRLASEIAVRLSAQAMGVDVRLQTKVGIPAQKFDGRRLPLFRQSLPPGHHSGPTTSAEGPPADLSEAAHLLLFGGIIMTENHERSEAECSYALQLANSAADLEGHNIETGKHMPLPQWTSLISQASRTLIGISVSFRLKRISWKFVARDANHWLRPSCLITVGTFR